ncbi:nicotinate-nucleotide--dimethylbenzimidazole phosphoribosyltransferase [Aquipuribacter sp. MA13-6]|uniref:nicotinate-nucleotide--dimethylbenzimidazole phosphoribosyltransferase n=1 Tax=unclassified Aquipuribacter TaxID=2635084 RepID=UPI003EEAA11A
MTTPADLQEIARDVRPTGRAAEQRARQGVEDLMLPSGATGSLQRLAVWWAGVRRDHEAAPPERVTAVVLAGDHGIAVRGVSALPLGHTAVTLRALRDGRSATHAVAAGLGVTVRAEELDVAGPLGPRGSAFDHTDAMDPDLLAESLDRGVALAEELSGQGHDLVVLGELNVGGSTTAAAVIGAAQRRRVLEVVGRGSGVDDTAWMRKAAAVREGLRRARSRPRDVPSILTAVGSGDVAACTALLLRCAALGLPVVLDGPVTTAAAVLAHRVSPTSRQWWLFAERGDEPCVHLAQDALGMLPVQDLGTRTGLAVPGLVALGTLRAAVALATSSATRAAYWPEDPAPDDGAHDGPHDGPHDGAATTDATSPDDGAVGEASPPVHDGPQTDVPVDGATSEDRVSP